MSYSPEYRERQLEKAYLWVHSRKSVGFRFSEDGSFHHTNHMAMIVVEIADRYLPARGDPPDWEVLTRSELRDLAKKAGIRNYSQMCKKTLIVVLEKFCA